MENEVSRIDLELKDFKGKDTITVFADVENAAKIRKLAEDYNFSCAIAVEMACRLLPDNE